MNYDKEIFFASWRHNLQSSNLENENNLAENDYFSKNYEAENHFSKWKHNLREYETIEEMAEEDSMEQVEDIFEDWIYNFHANELSRSTSGAGGGNSSKQMLKNKQRQQRRSKKKSKSPNQF